MCYMVKMNVFKKNNCRVCEKTFCCVTCRKKHEECLHHVYPDCDICFYGEIIIRNPSEDLLKHIKNHHWPLHCRICQRMFGSIDELIQHNLCPMSKKSLSDSSNKTPVRPNIAFENNNDPNYDSPPVMYPFGNNLSNNIIISVTNNIISLTTSTPMQGEQEKCFLDNISLAITPVEPFKEILENTTLPESIDKCKKSPINRRVTFNETQLTETLGNKKDKKNLVNTKGSLNKAITKGNQSDENLEASKIRQPDNDTLWETAISDSTQSLQEIGTDILEDITNEQINSVKNEKSVENLERKILNEHHVYSNIWSSMGNIVKNMLSGLSSMNSQSRELDGNVSKQSAPTKRQLSNKRLRSDSDVCQDFEILKKMKFTEIKCRKPINSIVPYKFVLEKKIVETCHKSTQTEE